MELSVQMKNITKTFGTVRSNDCVDLEIYRGEILAILGENGSGKTTLMNVLSGIYYPDEGEIFVNGQEVAIRSPKIAYELGIGMIHQHFKLVEVMTATENIVLGLKGKERFDLKKAASDIAEICKKYEFDLDPNQKVYEMSVSQRQTVEILKVLYRGANILILDEPTAVLTPQETQRLFQVLRNMRDADKTIILITHKLHEVKEISDRVVALRHGKLVGDRPTSETTIEDMTNMMVGHATTLNIERPEPQDPKPRLSVRDLSVVDPDGILRLDAVSFEARGGEVLGIAGISGCGQKELLESIAGLQRVQGGSVQFLQEGEAPEELIGRDPLEIAKLGVSLSFVPEDRLGMGLVGNMDLTDNMMLRSFRRGHSPFTDRKNPKKLANRVVEALDVSTPSLATPVRRLSGGNVQKVLVGREIAAAPKVLLTAYATRGLDIQSSYTIYDLINEQKKKGVAVVYVGEDLDVLLELCDRILVLCGGKVNGVLDARNTTREEVGQRMMYIEKKEVGE